MKKRTKPDTLVEKLAEGDHFAKISDRVKVLRAERGWTLDELSTRSGVSRSTLSKLERDQASPTYDVIQRLARGFGLSIIAFFDSAQNQTAAGRRSVSLASDEHYLEGRGYLYNPLCDDLLNKRMLPFRARILARTVEDAGGYTRHTGEECLFVLSGEVEFHTEHYAPLRLRAGDAVYIDSSMGHACTSLSDVPAEVFWITLDE